MGDYVRKSRRNVGIAEMEADHGGVRTGHVAMEEATSSRTSSKRMKISSETLLPNMSLGNHGYLVNSPENSRAPATSDNSEQVIPSCDNLCSSSSSSDHALLPRSSSNDCLRSVDLEAEGLETENSTYMNNKYSREKIPLSEVRGDSDEMESPVNKSTERNRKKSPAGKMPSTAEIEEFFSVAEKYEQKRFAEKYNYDVVKDVPLEGRYQWVRFNP